jgi:zinc D-Ala-D-Ala carboxypeptidase
MQLTKNFSLIELSTSETAVRKGVDNTPTTEVITNLRYLCENVLQPLREKYGKAINITSGYRSPKVNKLIGGSSTSDHCYGRAADFTVPDSDYKEVFEMLKTIEHDQLIWEFGNDISPQWIHVSYRVDGNRNQNLRAVKNKLGQTIYKAI